jgi:predicted nucleic acid-binding protein
MIVLDASAVVEMLLGTSLGVKVAERVARSDELHAPHLLDVEVLSCLRRLQRADEFTDERGWQMLQALYELDVERHAHDDLLPRAWELRQNTTAYDAMYLALAEALRAPLLTLDERLARAGGHHAQLELLR